MIRRTILMLALIAAASLSQADSHEMKPDELANERGRAGHHEHCQRWKLG